MLHPFHILTQTISPSLNDSGREELHTCLSAPDCCWESLLVLANHHAVTPLWYLQLKRHDLLNLAPTELQDYLQALYEANLDRSQAFLAALKALVGAFGEKGFAVMALKGGAAIVDDLYGDPGARIMGDLDLLVPREALEIVPEVMSGLGYGWDKEQEALWRDLPMVVSRHFPRCHFPDSPAAVEVHYKVLSREGDVFSAEAFLHRGISVGGQSDLLVPQATDRLLHNAVHAVSSERDWLHSRLGLRDLVEFAWLWQRDRGNVTIDPVAMDALGGMSIPVRVYATLAERLFSLGLNDVLVCGVAPRQWKRFELELLGQLSVSRRLVNFVARYPWWLLHNNRFAGPGIPRRKMFGYLLRRLFQRKTWAAVKGHWK